MKGSDIDIKVILVSQEGEARDAYLNALQLLGVEVDAVSSFSELYKSLSTNFYHGVIVDFKTKMKADAHEGELAHKVFEQFPFVQLKFDPETGTIQSLYTGQSMGSRSLESFIHEECRSMGAQRIRIKKGDVVSVNYSSFLDDGTIYETTLYGKPLRMTVGEGVVVPGFDNALTGMEVGDTKTILIEAEDAYGLRSEALVIDVSESSVESEEELKAGARVVITSLGAEPKDAIVLDRTGNMLKVDVNHPLAGQYVIFEIKIVEIAAK